MNKLTIPAILAATVLVAGIFAFMPVEQASTVHTTLATSADNTALSTDVGDASAGTIGGSLTAGIEAVETQIAALVTTGNAAEVAGTTASSTLTPIAAAAAGTGIAYITVDVTSANTLVTGGADTIVVSSGATVLCTLATAVAATTCIGAHTGANAITVAETDGGVDGTNAAFTVVVAVIASSPDTT